MFGSVAASSGILGVVVLPCMSRKPFLISECKVPWHFVRPSRVLASTHDVDHASVAFTSDNLDSGRGRQRRPVVGMPGSAHTRVHTALRAMASARAHAYAFPLSANALVSRACPAVTHETWLCHDAGAHSACLTLVFLHRPSSVHAAQNVPLMLCSAGLVPAS